MAFNCIKQIIAMPTTAMIEAQFVWNKTGLLRMRNELEFQSQESKKAYGSRISSTRGDQNLLSSLITFEGSIPYGIMLVAFCSSDGISHCY
jgi:hypothetical protein